MLTLNGSFLPYLSQHPTGVYRFGSEIGQAVKKLIPDLAVPCPPGVSEETKKQFSPTFVRGLIHAPGNKATPWEQLELPGYLRKHNNPLLLNLTNTGPLLYKNQVVTLHDLMFLAHPAWYSKKHYYLYKILMSQLAKKALKIITVSEFSKQDIIRYLGIPNQKIEVVYNGVDATVFNTMASQPPPSYGEYILSVSGLHPRKNFKNLIAAFQKLNMDNLKLVIVGPSIYGEHTETLMKNHDSAKIIFTGFVDDMELARLYQHAKLFVFPSLYEGFGIPPLEAMASGCPVVVSNTTSLPEVCGNAAEYVTPENVDSIVSGLTRMLKDPILREDYRQKGLLHVQNFTWDSSARKLVNILKAL